MQETIGQKLVSQIMENKNKAEIITTQRKNLEQYRKNEIWELRYKVYGPQIDALQSRLNKEVSELENLSKTEQQQKFEEVKELYKPYYQAKRILQFLQLKENQEKRNPQNWPTTIIKTEFVKVHQGGYLEDLGFVINEPFLNLHLFIISNNKPSNCYSLIVMGNTAFYDNYDSPLLKIPLNNKPEQWQHDAYYCEDKCMKNARIDSTIKTGKTPEELKQWLERNREKIFADFLKDFQAVKEEYEQVLKTYTLEDFKDLKEEEY